MLFRLLVLFALQGDVRLQVPYDLNHKRVINVELIALIVSFGISNGIA